MGRGVSAFHTLSDEIGKMMSVLTGIHDVLLAPPPDPVWLMYADHRGQGD